jgi:hypothetical protein
MSRVHLERIVSWGVDRTGRVWRGIDRRVRAAVAR